MSARREARARIPFAARPAEDGGLRVPASFLIGRCVEVWAEQGKPQPNYFSAMRRYNDARNAWGQARGLDDLDLQSAIPHGAPWSADYMTATGKSEQVTERFSRAGCTTADIPWLRAEADDLLGRTPAPRRTTR